MSSSSDEEEIVYGGHRALPVADFEEYDPNVPPATGEEYLRRVQLEAARCPKVVTANHVRIKTGSDPSQGSNISQNDLTFIRSKNPRPSEWQQALVADFSRTRTTLEMRRDSMTEEEKKRARSHHPRLDNTHYYKRWCLGVDVSTDSSDEELVESATKRRKGPTSPPVHNKCLPIKFLLSLDQQEVLTLLQLQIKWVRDYGFSSETTGLWIYCLLSALEKPLSSDAYSTLRDVSRIVSQYRQEADDDDDDDDIEENMKSADVIICLVGRYFDQHDLLD